jgi:hypothetical protein
MIETKNNYTKRAKKKHFCTHSLGSDASNIQRSIGNEFFPIDSNVKIAKKHKGIKKNRS